MLKPKTQNEINIIMNELIEKIAPIFGDKIKKVLLYDSYARGDYESLGKRSLCSNDIKKSLSVMMECKQ